MFAALSKLALRLRLKKKAASQSRKFLAWNNIQKIALILGHENQINKNEIDTILANSGKFVEVFYIEPASRQPSYSDWICFTKKDWSVFKLPKKDVESELRKKNFDLVINTCSNNLFSSAVSATLKAPFKCAGSATFDDADLIVKRKSGDLGQYLKDIFLYLKMIRT